MCSCYKPTVIQPLACDHEEGEQQLVNVMCMSTLSWVTGGPTYANFSYPDTADEELSQVDVDKVDQVVEQLQVTGNTIGQTASNSIVSLWLYCN